MSWGICMRRWTRIRIIYYPLQVPTSSHSSPEEPLSPFSTSKRSSSTVIAIDLHKLRTLSYALREESESKIVTDQWDVEDSIRRRVWIISLTDSTVMSKDVVAKKVIVVSRELNMNRGFEVANPPWTGDYWSQLSSETICTCLLSTRGWQYYVNMRLEGPCDARWCLT